MKKILIIAVLSSFSLISPQTKLSLHDYNIMHVNSGSEYLSPRFSIALTDNEIPDHYSPGNLFGQALAGSFLAAGFSIIPLAAGWADAWSGGSDASQAAFEVLFFASYLFGAATGVHWIADFENPELSFWCTAAYSAIGGGAGALLLGILATQYTTIPPAGVVVIALSPIISSILYASLISDWPQDKQSPSLYKNKYSHKDLVEQSKLLDIELLRIKF